MMRATASIGSLPLERIDPTLGSSRARRYAAWGGALLAALLTVYLLWVAATLTVDYFDSYDIFLNARCIATGAGQQWREWRSLGLSAFLSPWFVIERWVDSTQLGFRAGHIMAIGFWAALVLLSYRLFCLYLPKAAALPAALLMAFNPLMVHTAPMAKEDLPAAALTVACFYAYLTASKTQKTAGFILTGILGGLAMATRQNLPPLILAVWFFAEAARTSRRRDPLGNYLIKFGTLLVLPLIVFFLFPTLVYPRVGVSSVLGAPAFLLHDMHAHFERVGEWKDEGIAKNFRFVAEAMTYPVAILALAGIAIATRRRRAGSFFNLVWFAIFFGAHTFYFKHREARYLFPAFPPLYFFAGAALEAGSDWSARLKPVWQPVTVSAAILFVFAVPLAGVVRECQRFRDPIYHDNFEQRVSAAASDSAGAHRLWWLGPYYPLHPHDYVFDREDESTSLYHFGCPPVIFFTGRLVWQLRSFEHRTGEVDQIVWTFPEVVQDARDGDGFIVNQETSDYDTRTVPESLKPLAVRELRRWEFVSHGSSVLRSATSTAGGAVLRCDASEHAMIVSGSGFGGRSCAVYLRLAPGPRTAMLVADITNGNFSKAIPTNAGSSVLSAVTLFFDERKREFTPPR